ncbi:hypothetical protein FN846DRAFT_363052 [Sphaerosporella brunnea]|uniref:Transcription elongation factor Eaf N-terminal domain-containing protein n=1 Tax=Sphaerosporella brunnea TaxID=1250544 RepID=A0A5J5EH47_9PEZI|nr:hypothetical protein FN846DRAFT_363052 [Sphaerosporella brunnea]
MPPPAAPPIRIDRQADYKIVLGQSLTECPGGYNALKYNHKPTSFILNPSSPKITPSSSSSGDYDLTFTPPTTSTQITYTGSARTPTPKAQHFLLFDPVAKHFTLERLDATFVFNAEVYAKLHPPLESDGQAAAAGGDEEVGISDSSDEADDAGVYDFRKFMGRTTAAQEKRQKRQAALKSVGVDVVDIPEPEPQDDDADLVIPDAPPPPTAFGEEDSDMDAPGESDDEAMPSAPPPPPPPPPPTKRKPGPKPKAQAKPRAPRAPAKKKAQPAAPPPPPPPPPPPQVDEIVIPDVPAPPVDSDEEEIEFSEEEDAAAAPTQEDEEDTFELDINKELEEALGSGDNGSKQQQQPQQSQLVIEEDESDEDEDPGTIGVIPAAPGGAPKSLREMFGTAEQEEEEDSESEEE